MALFSWVVISENLIVDQGMVDEAWFSVWIRVRQWLCLSPRVQNMERKTLFTVHKVILLVFNDHAACCFSKTEESIIIIRT